MMTLAAMQTSRASESQGLRELVVNVTVNGVAYPQAAIVLLDKVGALYAQQQEFDTWRIDSLSLPRLDFEGQEYIQLPLFAGSNTVLDETLQKLSFTVAPDRLGNNEIAGYLQGKLKAVRSGNGAFLNYDLSNSQFSGSTANSGFFEAGVFTRYGVGTSNHFVSRSDLGNTTVRLDSTWELDMPESLSAIRVGDSISRNAPWSLSNRIGGIQYSTSFRTQPFLAVSPQRGATGIASSPSTVEVYVNNVLQSRQTVAPGPFSIDNIPTTTGVGDVRVVVRDITGQEQILTQNFYQSQGLLRVGQNDFSYELGSFRRNFARANSDYGDVLASATHRYGFTNDFTAGYHAEASSGDVVAGGGFVYALSNLGSINLDLAASNTTGGNGGLALLGFERTTRQASFGVLTQVATEDFRVLSEVGLRSLAERTFTTRASQGFDSIGSLSGSYSTTQSTFGDSRIFTLSFGRQILDRALVSLSYSNAKAQQRQQILFLSAFVSFDKGRTLSFLANQRKGENLFMSTQFRESLPAGTGSGYAVEAASQQFYRGEYSRNTSIGTYSAAVGTSRGDAFSSLSASGGIATLGGGLYFSRRITDAFGVVRVKDFKDLTVFSENLPVGQTDSSGEFLVPSLRAYQDNKISIDPNELPFEVELTTAELSAVPYYRSGVLLDFPLKKVRALTLEAVDSDLKPIPAGANLLDEDGNSLNISVGNGGVIYISEYPSVTALIAKWKGGVCKMNIGKLDDRFKSESLIDLGVLKCEAVN